jgi:hypothetical protein
VLLIPIVITLDHFIFINPNFTDNQGRTGTTHAAFERGAAWMSAALLVAPMCIFLIPNQFFLIALPLGTFMVILIRTFPREKLLNSARAQ